MAVPQEIGKRTVVSMIDGYATDEPEKIWVSVPKDNEDVSKGFRDISFKEFADAIDRASWWIRKHVFSNQDGPEFETLAYAGPKDIRYPIIAVAALKCRKKLLLCSPLTTQAAQFRLLDATNCTKYLHASEVNTVVKSIVDESHHVTRFEVPSISEWLHDGDTVDFPYNKTWEEAANDPWLIFHTSGTTGFPKPIVYTNEIMASMDIAKLMPDAEEMESSAKFSIFRGRRVYTSLPTLHMIGMTASLQWPVFTNTILVYGTPGETSPAQVLEVLRYGKVSSVCMPPSVIEDICREPGGLETLRQLDTILFAGAPLKKRQAELLVEYCKVMPGLGSTEAGPHWLTIRGEPDEWEYYKFRPVNGIEFEHRGNQLYELIFRRKPEYEKWQQIFKIYPDLQEFPTKDLWTKHPEKEGLWRYAGRLDDMIVLSHGSNLFAAGVEGIIQQHPDIRAALVGGEGRQLPFLIIDLFDRPAMSSAERAAKLKELWPIVERANETCSEHVKLTSKLTLFTEPETPLPMTGKDTVMRRQALELYSEQIEALYTSEA